MLLSCDECECVMAFSSTDRVCVLFVLWKYAVYVRRMCTIPLCWNTYKYILCVHYTVYISSCICTQRFGDRYNVPFFCLFWSIWIIGSRNCYRSTAGNCRTRKWFYWVLEMIDRYYLIRRAPDFCSRISKKKTKWLRVIPIEGQILRNCPRRNLKKGTHCGMNVQN